MDLVTFEKALITQLENNFSGNPPEIRSYPDSPESYIGQTLNDNGAVLIAFQGAVWEAPEGNSQSQLTQDSIYGWQFNIINKNLSEENNQHEAYGMLEQVRTILSGFTPTGFDDAGVLYPVSSGFLERTHGFYVYQITMGHSIEEAEA